MPSLSVSGGVYSRSRSTRCRSLSRRRRPAISARRYGCRGSIGWPELLVEVKFLAWTEQGLLRQVIYQGVREEKPAGEIRRP